jgi:hypothetical protein
MHDPSIVLRRAANKVNDATPAEPIEEDIPVCATTNPSQGLEDFPDRSRGSSPDPTVEILLIHVDALYEYQCLDPIARRRSAARLFDPTW